ncbi:GtrA family protein [Paenibacillus sp. p3-SID1389]|uniref:GtrA family protein n=1 Tax=Paenibacillus sp. p3-SID1389 TaxID=2916364 RepID=UPI0021A96EDD|nr:GtrA family protein [Paenibacillus sp. p3-SID1389]MCT2195588.1 GtrA family protein [Paenibacillus sp. p3-SID1389]
MKVEEDRPTLWTRYLNSSFLKFVIVGGLNTAITYGAYLLLLLCFEYKISYSISYILGILFSYYFNTKFVFREKITLLKFLKFPVVYLAQYLINVVILHILVEYINMPAEIVPLIVIVVSLPITYLLSKFIIKGK